MNNKYCPNCGAENLEANQFCHSCGNKLQQVSLEENSERISMKKRLTDKEKELVNLQNKLGQLKETHSSSKSRNAVGCVFDVLGIIAFLAFGNLVLGVALIILASIIQLVAMFDNKENKISDIEANIVKLKHEIIELKNSL